MIATLSIAVCKPVALHLKRLIRSIQLVLKAEFYQKPGYKNKEEIRKIIQYVIIL